MDEQFPSDIAYIRALQSLVNDNAQDLYQSLHDNHDPLGTGLVPASTLGTVISKHLGLTGEDIGLLLSCGSTSSFQVSQNDLNARSGILCSMFWVDTTCSVNPEINLEMAVCANRIVINVNHCPETFKCASWGVEPMIWCLDRHVYTTGVPKGRQFN